MWKLLELALRFLVLMWLGFTLLGSFFKEDPKKKELAAAIESLALQCYLEFPSSEFRIEPRFGGNVRIYVSKHVFENIPYPDRDATMERIGKAWCSKVVEKLYMPVVSINDVRTGERLSSYNCVIGTVQWFPGFSVLVALLAVVAIGFAVLILLGILLGMFKILDQTNEWLSSIKWKQRLSSIKWKQLHHAFSWNEIAPDRQSKITLICLIAASVLILLLNWLNESCRGRHRPI